MLLKNIGMQLQQIGLQINNTGKQMSCINNIYGIQLQQMGIQISDFSFQIYNIGMKMLNINLIQEQNLIQMNNIMNQINMKNLNESIENSIINNNMNNIYNINKEFDEKILNILFQKKNGLKTIISISNKASIKDLFNLYRIKIGENELLQNYYFIFNGQKINPNDSKSLFHYGFKGSDIILVENRDLLGGPSIILKVISNGIWDVKLNGMILNDYLIKYFSKIGKSNLSKQIKSLPIINILDFLKEIDDFPNQ